MLRLIRSDGALTIRDIDDDVLVDKEHPWASRKPSKRALQLLFYTGMLTISERNGMLKTYELMARHFGWDRPPKPASAGEHRLSARPRLALPGRRQPQFDLPSRRAEQAGRPRLIGARVRRKRTGAGRASKARQAGALGEPEALRERRRGDSGSVHILSPFDPLIIQRKRSELFFDYEHRFEAYVPKEKRRVRLFRAAGPRRRRDRRGDRPQDRPQEGNLLMQKWTWVGDGAERPRKELKARIEEELHRFERFQLAE